jgi:hypothetical protein
MTGSAKQSRGHIEEWANQAEIIMLQGSSGSLWIVMRGIAVRRTARFRTPMTRA